MASADLLLHPVRLRIVEAFLGDRALTTVALRSELPDVPLASLYRHVARLVDAGVLAIVAERRVRGALERTYTLRLSAAQLSAADVARMTPDDHRQAFMAFTAGLLGDFDRYLARGGSDLARDGAGYRMAAMWLSELEYLAFLRELSAVVQSYMTKPPAPGRRRRILRTILIPGAEDLGHGPGAGQEDRGLRRSERRAGPGPQGAAGSPDPLVRPSSSTPASDARTTGAPRDGATPPDVRRQSRTERSVTGA